MKATTIRTYCRCLLDYKKPRNHRT